MFRRNVITELEVWVTKSDHKPLVLRGDRQVGKTTIINEFAKRFEQYIYLNLELPNDRLPFEQFNTIETLVQTLFFLKNQTLSKKGNTLIFIDEILHLYMDLAPHQMAIRFYAGEISITEATTSGGKKYKLLNLPYYLVSQTEHYLQWFQQQIENNLF